MAVLSRSLEPIAMAPYGLCSRCRRGPATAWLVVEVRRADKRAQWRHYRRCVSCAEGNRVAFNLRTRGA